MSNLSIEIEKVLKQYPSLRESSFDGKPVLLGSFMAHDPKSGVEIEPYDIAVTFPNDYPFALPLVWETGGKIIRHLLSDGSLCFGNWQDVAAVCRNGISLKWFFEAILNPHLCREFVRDKTGEYPTGERSHGRDGIWEGYYDIFQTNDKPEILRELAMIFEHAATGRNDPCYCGSGKKFKRCHQPLEEKVLLPGRENAIHYLRKLTESVNYTS